MFYLNPDRWHGSLDLGFDGRMCQLTTIHKLKCHEVCTIAWNDNLATNGRHFPDDSFTCIFVNENVWISIKISLMYVPKGPINNTAALVQIMAWRWPGDKPMMVRLPTHTCIWPQWFNAPCEFWNIALVAVLVVSWGLYCWSETRHISFESEPENYTKWENHYCDVSYLQ